MATNHTTNYQLNLWEPEDSFLREEFNENSQKIDGALGEKVSILVDAYEGDDSETRTIPLPFTPTAVLVWGDNGVQATPYGGYSYGGMAFSGHPCRYGGETVLSVTENGFQVAQGDRAYANKKGSRYYYLALH